MSSTVLPSEGVGSSLWSAVAVEGQAWLSNSFDSGASSLNCQYVGKGKGGHLPGTYPTSLQKSGVANSLGYMLSSKLRPLLLPSLGQLYCTAQVRGRLALPSIITSEGQDQFCTVL